MAAKSLDRMLAELEESRYRFGRGEGARIATLLRAFDKMRFPDASSLIRFHETLLFLRAFPQGADIVGKTEALLNDFWKRVAELRQRGLDLSSWDTFEFSGVAGTAMEDTLSFDIARWLVRHMPGKVEIAWDDYEPGRELGTTLPQFIPLLEDDAFVEADTPWQRWIETASPSFPHGLKPLRQQRLGTSEAAPLSFSTYRDSWRTQRRGKPRLYQKSASVEWLIRRFETLAMSEHDKAELYDSLRLPLRWDLGNSKVSRTRNWERVRKVFYHNEPLISRSQVSLAEELAKKPPALVKLSDTQGGRVMDTIREIMLVRYRELYGTTLGNAASVVRADVGRGLTIYLWNLPPARRLPLRAYVAGFSVKNGVPVNYIEAIGLCEWMEVGFNTFYTFRGGETAWIYAQVLRCLCHLMGTTCVSVYPYQLGHDNDEAIDSGAFWFYRKLGFRPGRPELLRLVEQEEKKIAANRKYRTSARTLRRLAAGHVFYELPGSECGAWDRFSTRNIGLRVNARMAREFDGDSRRMRAESARGLARILGVATSSWTTLERSSLESFAVVMAAAPDISSWTRPEKDGLVRIIRGKVARDEMRYLHLMQRHERLRSVLLKLGS